MSRLSVIHCIPTMEGGGAERQLTYLASDLVNLGWSVHVVVTRRGPNWERLRESGAEIHELALRSAYDWRAMGAIRGIIRRVRPDVVQAWLLQMEVLAGLAAMSCRTPWVFSERSSAKGYPPTAKNRLRQFMARRATAIVSNSMGGDDYWKARAGRRPRRYVIPNGIPLDIIDAAPVALAAEMGVRDGVPIVLFAGRLESEKNIPTVLRAFSHVLAHHDVQVCCCGDGALNRDVAAWASATRGRAVLRGHTRNLWGFMKGAAVLVSASLFEGSPNVVLEAMACGVPLVVSDIPQHRELLDDSAALLVPPHSAEAVATAIGRVLCDPVSAAERARVARERAARYSVSAVAQRYDDVYREILVARAGA